MKINGKMLREYLSRRGITLDKLSVDIGHAKNYMSYILSKEDMPTSEYKLMCHILGVDEDKFAPHDTAGYSLGLVYDERSLRIKLLHGDKEVCSAWSLIKSSSDLDFLQAISYAAHMMYKFAQQTELGKENRNA